MFSITKRAGRFLLRARRCLSAASSAADQGQPKPSEDSTQSFVKQQILRAGLHYLKGDTEALKENVRRRRGSVDVDELDRLHREYGQMLFRIQELRHERNVQSKEFLTKTKEEQKALGKKAAELKSILSQLETELQLRESDFVAKVTHIPNESHPSVPIGSYDSAKVVYLGGAKPEFSFPPRDHVAIGENLRILDFVSAAQASGHRYYYLKGAAAMLEVALVQYAMQKAVARGYLPVVTPDVIKASVVEGCGFQPRGVSTQVYSLHPHHGPLCLSGTAEIPLAGMLMNSVIPLSELPLKFVAYGRCHRAETGGSCHAYRGIYRVHQFTKVELFVVTANESGEESNKMLEEIVELQKDIFTELGLHFRVLDMPTEELGAPAYRKYDIEAWMPGKGEYGEVTSASNCTDFQSRRLSIEYASHAGKNQKTFAHTLNGTACAIPRTIIALLEKNQQQDGRVVLPKVLHPFLPSQFWNIDPATVPKQS
eukprot:Em0019g956a